MEDKILVNLSTDANHTFECETNIIGREGEGNTSRFEITVPEKLKGCSVYLDFEKPNGEKLRTPELKMENGVAVYDVVAYLLAEDGEIKVQAVLQTSNGQIWKSSIKSYFNQNSINALEETPQKEDLLTEIQKVLDELNDYPTLSRTVQTTGESTTDVMSQKAVTDELNKTAPSGYGLGGDCVNQDLDAITKNGFYYANIDNMVCKVTHENINTKHATQTAISTTINAGCILIRTKTNGVWGEWEWINPPMQVGVEYRTTERWDGKCVYRKRINLGGLPSNSSKIVSTGLNNPTIIRTHVVAYLSGSSQTITLPFIDLGGLIAGCAYDGVSVNIYTNNAVFADYTDAFIDMWYTI